MKLKYIYIQKALYIGAMLLFLICVHIVSIYIFAVHRFSITYDLQLTSPAQEALQDFIKPQQFAQGAEQFDKTLQTNFPYICAITTHHKPNGTIDLSLHAAQPYFRIGNKSVITVRKDMVNADCYMAEAVAALPKIECKEDFNTICDLVFDYIAAHDQLLAGATLIWNNEYEIHITLPSSLQLICNKDMHITQQLIDQCTIIAQEAMIQSPSAKSILADVRFADQIVISKIES